MKQLKLHLLQLTYEYEHMNITYELISVHFKSTFEFQFCFNSQIKGITVNLNSQLMSE